VDVVFDSSVEAFLSHAGATLMRDEAANSLIFGLCDDLRRGRYAKHAPVLARVNDSRGRLLTVAFQTPPHNLVVSFCEDSSAWPALATALANAKVTAPGALGPAREVVEFADAWKNETGTQLRMGLASRIHQLSKVLWPAQPGGEMRNATTTDLELVRDWTVRFMQESVPDEVVPIEEIVRTAEQRVAEGKLFLWIDGDSPVCMAQLTGQTPNGIRISGVYTPPDRRRKGFASALVAHLSQRQLDEGRRFCFLYTDAENPVSNRIYQRIGYREVCECRHVLFDG